LVTFIFESSFTHYLKVTKASTWKTITGTTTCDMRPEMTFTRKNGNQQMMKIPMTVPRVFAAFFSSANLASLREILKF